MGAEAALHFDAESAWDSKAVSSRRVAVLVPCYNEALTVRRVIADFRAALPSAEIYVFDNRSTDATVAEATAGGAHVRSERWPGKGNVVRRMFSDVEADVYVMVDGDATYDASASPKMVSMLIEGHLDMVVGTRRNVYDDAHRRGHGLGNRLFNSAYRSLFGNAFTDIFSGYRVFSRRFAKSFPAVSSGFEIETEMSVQASQLRMPTAEFLTEYGAREEGSVSKLNTVRDALRIAATFLILFKEIRPARFFGWLAAVLGIAGLVIALPVIQTFLDTGLVPRQPTAILATGMVLMSSIFVVCGLVLDSVARGRLEQKRLWYVLHSMPTSQP